MYRTRTGGEGCAGVGVTVTGRRCDAHFRRVQRDKMGQVTCLVIPARLFARFIYQTRRWPLTDSATTNGG